jgi:hypothetical protein
MRSIKMHTLPNSLPPSLDSRGMSVLLLTDSSLKMGVSLASSDESEVSTMKNLFLRPQTLLGRHLGDSYFATLNKDLAADLVRRRLRKSFIRRTT